MTGECRGKQVTGGDCRRDLVKSDTQRLSTSPDVFVLKDGEKVARQGSEGDKLHHPFRG